MMAHLGLRWKKTNEAEINENEKVVSGGSQVLKRESIFKQFVTVIEKVLAVEGKLVKMP